MVKLAIDPMTRIEGHLKIEVDIEGGKVVDAKSMGTLFRGFEIILKGRDPRDASQITQRICGVCPTAHATASVRCLDNAFGIKPPPNGRIMRNLIFGADYLMSHILHFYHLVALDYVKGPDTEPFIPRYEGDYRLDPKTNKAAVEQYVKALDIRQKCHQMVALFGGKAPIVYGMVAGGATEVPSLDKIVSFKWRLQEIRDFIDNTYLPTVYLVAGVYKDLFNVGAGCKNLVAYFHLNNEKGGFIEAEGEDRDLERFIEDIPKLAPSLTRIETIDFEYLEPIGYKAFEIRRSEEGEEKFTLISPDIATFDECLSELFSPQNFRYRYPFIKCTLCGPRFTIIKDIPYDRHKTTMSPFKMCSICLREYEDPSNRRFHAQPNACPSCGPSLKLINKDGETISGDPIDQSLRLLLGGKIIAIKGLGGFHLACDAKNEEAVST